MRDERNGLPMRVFQHALATAEGDVPNEAISHGSQNELKETEWKNGVCLNRATPLFVISD